ncbi:MAG: tetratricopeptide repeat protein [Candidatus Margulisiibacteriota bacterium]
MRFRVILAVLILAVFSTSSLAYTLETRDAFKKGYKLLEEGEYYSSIKSFKGTLGDRSYPLLDYSYYYMAQAYQKGYRFKESLQVYEIVVNYFKNSILIPKALFGIAQCQIELENYTDANSTLRILIAQFPEHELIPEARYLLGTNLEKAGKFVDAARVYRNLDLLHPESDFAEKALERLDWLAKKKHLAGYEAPAATIYNLGIKYFKKRNYTKSKGYFMRLAKFYKKSSFHDEAIFMLGRIFLRRGKLSLATRYFKKAINLNKDSKPQAMFYLALTYAYLGSPQATIYTLEKTVSMYPNSHSADDALYYLGRYYKKAGDTQNALRCYKKLASFYPSSEFFADSIWHTGNIYFKQENYKKAYDQFRQALRLPPEKASDRLLFWAAKCAEKIGKKEKAKTLYKTTIQRYDHSYYGYRAREELQKFGIQIKANAVPEISEMVEEINGGSPETATHEEKYKELLALGLGDEAAQEASFLVEKVPLSKKDRARIAKYHAYVMKGRYARPIDFADKKIKEAMLAGSLSSIDPRLWRFSYPRGYSRYVEKYSKMYGLDPYLTYAVIREESLFKSRALSRSWAHGLMQIIPSTGRNLSRLLGIRYSRWKLYNPRVNIHMGTYYLSSLIKRFDGNVALALAGYNGGPVRVKRWLKKYNNNLDIDEFIEDIPFRETRYYVKKVLKSYYGYKRTYAGG